MLGIRKSFEIALVPEVLDGDKVASVPLAMEGFENLNKQQINCN